MSGSDHSTAAEKAKYEQMWQHDDYRKFSPGLHALEKLDLAKQFQKLGVRSILDAGCGSGKFMRRILEEHAGTFTIRGFDIADNCLDPWFGDRFRGLLTTGCLWEPGSLPAPNDAVVCTDVMEHIPTDKVPAVLRNLCSAATRVVFFGIALFPDAFGPKVIGAPLHLTVESPDWWTRQITSAGMQVVSAAVLKNSAQEPMWLYVFTRPAKTG
jgi:hypothetical protein